MIKKTKGGITMEEKCILCKKNPAVGITTRLFCENCSKKDILTKMAALQRDTRFNEGYIEYQNECWGKEKVLKTNLELSKHLQKKCVSFSPEHFGFKEIVNEVNELNGTIPKLITAKIELRKHTKIGLEELKGIIKDLIKEIEKIGIKKGKKELKKLKDLKDNLKELKIKQETLEEELKKLKKIE